MLTKLPRPLRREHIHQLQKLKKACSKMLAKEFNKSRLELVGLLKRVEIAPSTRTLTNGGAVAAVRPSRLNFNAHCYSNERHELKSKEGRLKKKQQLLLKKQESC